MIQLALAFIMLAASFAGGWFINQWRIDANTTQKTLEQVRYSSAIDIRRYDNQLEAISKSVVRERKARLEADALRSSIDSLSSHTASALRTAEDSHATALVAASTFKELLDTELRASREVSETCDRHVSDLQTYIDAWPKSVLPD